VFISGRPLYVNAELNASDAFVAAWLPGSEGNGVSDVLLSNNDGSIKHDFSGRLSYSWPSSPRQATVNRNDPDYDDLNSGPLLPYGFGLSYSAANNQGQLRLGDSLEVELIGADGGGNLILFKKTIRAPYKAMVSSANNTLSMTSNIVEVDGLKVRTIDKQIQEDARQVVFAENQTSKFSLVTSEPVDLTQQRENGQSLFLNLRIDSAINGPIKLSMGCETDCPGAVDITSELQKLAPSEWQEVNVSLACFEKAGISLDKIVAPFQITSAGALTISFSEVSFRTTPNVDECE
jgi:beta-glucosidase